MPDEVNIDDLLELETEEERARKIQVVAKDCAPLLSPGPLSLPQTTSYAG